MTDRTDPVFRVLVEKGRVYADGQSDRSEDRIVVIVDQAALQQLRRHLSPEAILVLQEVVASAAWDDDGLPVVERTGSEIADALTGGVSRRGWSKTTVNRYLNELADAGLILERSQTPRSDESGGFSRARIVLNPDLQLADGPRNAGFRILSGERFRGAAEADRAADQQERGGGFPASAPEQGKRGGGKSTSAPEQGKHRPDTGRGDGFRAAANRGGATSHSAAEQAKRGSSPPRAHVMNMNDEHHHHDRGQPATPSAHSHTDAEVVDGAMHTHTETDRASVREQMDAWGFTDADRFIDSHGLELVAGWVAFAAARPDEIKRPGAYVRACVRKGQLAPQERAIPRATQPPVFTADDWNGDDEPQIRGSVNELTDRARQLPDGEHKVAKCLQEARDEAASNGIDPDERLGSAVVSSALRRSLARLLAEHGPV